MIEVQVRNPNAYNTAPLKTVEAPTPTIDNVRSVYSGSHGCMCGCNGKHKYNPAMVAEAAKNRGYSIDEDEVSKRSVKTIITKLLNAGPQTDEGKERSYVFAETATRVYVAYFAEGVK